MNVSTTSTTTTTTTTDQKLYVLHVMNRVSNIHKHFFFKKWLSKSKEYIRIEKEIIRTDQQTATWSESTQG